MINQWQFWISIIIDFVAAIATPVSIFVAIKQYKKTLSVDIKTSNTSTTIYITNESPYPILVKDILLNKKPYIDTYIMLLGYESKQIPFSNESIKNVLKKGKIIKVVVKYNNHKSAKRKVKLNEIEI